jgi:putative SOS response-associated peptidase YedK
VCGRFTQHYTWAEVHAFLSVFGPPRNLQPHYNIAPTMTVDVIRLDKHGARELVPMRWAPELSFMYLTGSTWRCASSTPLNAPAAGDGARFADAVEHIRWRLWHARPRGRSA